MNTHGAAEDGEVVRVRKSLEHIQAEMYSLRQDFRKLTELYTQVQLIQDRVNQVVGPTGVNGKLSRIEVDLKSHGRLITTAVGALSILAPLCFWMLTQLRIAMK